MPRYLVVANQTLTGERLLRRIRACVAEGPASFHVVVPATPLDEQLVRTDGDALAVAWGRLRRATAVFYAEGIPASGEVGDANPVVAVEHVLRRDGPFDAIILSTLPAGFSRWVHLDVGERLARRTGLPIWHVIAQPTRSAGLGSRRRRHDQIADAV
jgi:hypothetical protein